MTAAEARRFLARFDTSSPPHRRRRGRPRRGRPRFSASSRSGRSSPSRLAAEPPSLTPLYLDDRASLLVNYYVERKGKRSYEVTDEEALAFYNEHLADRFTTPESITFQHVFLRADRHAPEELARLEQEHPRQARGGRSVLGAGRTVLGVRQLEP